MERRRRPRRLAWSDHRLERRELPSAAAPADVAAIQSASQSPAGEDLFHQNGINGLILHKSFVDRLNARLAISETQTSRVTQAFQVFASNYVQMPPGSTLSSLLASLTTEVNFALTNYEVLTSNPSPSVATSIRFSPLAPRALIPYADGQIDELGATLAAAPLDTDPTSAVNTAVNAILNAEAETTIHPKLFLSPDDFYINPNVTYDVTFTGAPASFAPGVFVRGPHGAILPGAPLRPRFPL
jgi:hypothetical protein